MSPQELIALAEECEDAGFLRCSVCIQKSQELPLAEALRDLASRLAADKRVNLSGPIKREVEMLARIALLGDIDPQLAEDIKYVFEQANFWYYHHQMMASRVCGYQFELAEAQDIFLDLEEKVAYLEEKLSDLTKERNCAIVQEDELPLDAKDTTLVLEKK